MNRDEFEKAYAEKYLKSDLERSSHDTLLSMIENRDGEVYTDHHIDLCWKVQKLQDLSHYAEIKYDLEKLEW